MNVPLPNTTAVPVPAGSETQVPDVLLHRGDSGEAVRTIQQKLNALGFNPGRADGQYGSMTEEAIKAFQQAHHLQSSGYIDQQTIQALGFQANIILPEPVTDTTITPELIAQLFPDAPVENIRSYLPFILNALSDYGLNDKTLILMAVVTVKVETGRFAPISEYPSQHNTSPGGHPFDLYDFRQDLGNNATGDGERYRGRGFIQLTGKANYQSYSQRLGLGDQLVSNPDSANDPRIAARLLACFLKDRETAIREALANRDWVTARKAINGGINGLAQFEHAYQAGLVLFA